MGASIVAGDSPAFLPSRPADGGTGGCQGLKGVRQKIVKAFDADGDHRLDSDERAALRDRARAWVLSRFDENGDGQLDATERASLKRALGADLQGVMQETKKETLPPGAVEI